MSFPFFFSFFFPNVDVRCQTVLAENEKKIKQKTEDGGGKKGAQKKKKGKKKTFDRLLESKPRDKFESLEMHLFFF